MALYAISQLTDKQQIREFLDQDIHYAAYALGDLEAPYENHATWYAASQRGAVDGLALVYEGLDPAVLFLMGEPSAVSALLMHGVGPDDVFYTARSNTEEMLAGFYALDHVSQMFRMRVTSGIFVPLPEEVVRANPITPLDETHVPDILNLIEEASHSDGRDLRDVAFAPEMVRDGTYRGVYQDGKLAAVAGTHIVARQARMAAIGNVVVHPDARRSGLGAAVSHAVTRALLDGQFELVVLNVRQNNQPALRMYRRLGFKQVGTFIEGLASRR